ncbi:probable helicase senataxin [Stomoxys calcitrans]|uniref:probable helicase senataxin n=1 Tax=Stomoxys calcitrans TaxID=35570 RepID=UPI0027E387F1|nr:probable helicase senataxin [Stomoxys calcitrans]
MSCQRYSSWVLQRQSIGECHRLRVGVSSVGRHSSSLIRILDSHYVSRHHAEIEVSLDDQSVTIKDLNSVNGVFVNNVLHKSSTITLSSEDTIGIGVSTNCNEEEDELTLPIYNLKYMPITRAKNNANTAQRAVKRESDNIPSTSRAAPSASAKPNIEQPILIISDDEDEIDGLNFKVKKQEENKGNEPNANEKQQNLNPNSLELPQIVIKKEKIPCEKEQPKAIGQKNKPIDKNKEIPNVNLVTELTLAGTSKHSNETFKDKQLNENALPIDRANQTISENKPPSRLEKDKEQSIHIPIISEIKQELIRSVSADVKDIFGDLDDDEKDKLKEINPLVYNDLSGKPLLLPTSSATNLLAHGEFITLLSDEEEEEEEELGIFIPNSPQKHADKKAAVPTTEIAKSPNIFNTSLNDSIEDTSKALEVLKNHLNETKSKEQSIANDNIDLDDYTSYEPHSEDEDEFMFSQVLLNDMKAELQDDFKKDLDDDSNDAAHPDNDAAELPIQIKQEPDWEKNSSLLSELDNTSWVISDEEDYDKELETKVSDWSSKIFSQSYNNMSQIYDLDTNITDDEDDGEDDVLEDIGRLEDDIDAITDLYNSINEENEQGQKEEDKEKEGSKIIPEVEAKRVLDKQENESLKSEQQQTDSTVRTMDEREKSPELVATKLDAESPLIRPRLKSFTKCKPVLSSSEDEFENDNREPQKPHRPAEQQPETNNVTPTPLKAVDAEKPPAIRTIPQIISPPSLPKHKGKLRGVSAEPSSPSTTKHKNVPLLTKKLHNIREQIWAEETHKSLKRKWTEKPSIGKKRDKERMKVMKECRKDKLKQLAEKPISSSKDSLKRKSSSSSSGETNAKKAKVKVTVNNRGAFLTENQPKAPVPVTATKAKIHETTAFKIPKVIANHKCDETIKEGLKRSNSIDEIKKREPLKRGASLDGGLTTFSQEISKADQILFKKTETKCTNQPNKRTTMLHADGPSAVCKEAVAARALRTTNKITFASMERNITESERNKNKLNTMCNKRCNKPIENPPSILSSPVRGHSKKKTVRFNDTPIIHYIERVYGARKVAGKDILPLTTHKDRRHMIRRTYPIIDNTDKIITQILCWSDEWLVKRNAAVDAAGDIVYPMPTHFSSFEHYKSIMFPLMKLEFASLLERQYNQTSHIKKYKVNLEYVTTNLDRLMLVTKFNYQNRKEMDSAKYDLVILESKQINTDMFAYLTSTRKAAGSCNTMVFEIVPKNITKEFFCGIHELTVRPVIDNVRVEFGAFNAVYQLEATPLFKKILNPVELLQCRHPAKKKVIYRGFNQLNERQHQVLLNTYSRIIDESSPNVSLIQGPPGTGKSCVITNLALQTMYGDEVRCMDKKILVCAQSNAAVDVIAEKLFDISMRMRPERRFRLIRYGLQEKINPFLHPVTLPHIIQQEQIKKLKATNPEISMENKENLKNQMLQLEAQIADLSKRNIKGTVEEDMLLEKQRQLQLMRNISNQFTRPEDERSIATWFLSNANIVCATLSSCVKLSQFVNYFDICIIDEATQCTEPWTLLPLKFGINSLVLVGDTQQLPATILSKKANELGLGKSMFTRIQNCLDTLPSSAHNSVGTITPNYIISGLQTQYRMHPEICKWPNQYFYRNELIHGRITLEFKSPLVPFSVLNLAYTQNEACHNGKITNNLEAEFVAKLLKALDGFIPNKYNSYGVITPYAQHRATLEHAIRSLGLTNIMVNTIESYQGLEKDVIVISNARTSGVGFLANPQRLNVALTRPKKCLILCGNFKNLEIVPAWRCLLQSARERNLYHEISTNCINNIHTNVIDKIRIKK